MAEGMSGMETVIGLTWVAVGIIAAFVVWQFVAPYLPAKTA